LLGKKITFNTALFLTKGKGYYEQYKLDEAYADYGFPDPLPAGGIHITNSDIVRQLWLDNDFYGNIFSLHYKKDKIQLTLGGAYTRYDGNHFGKVIWAEKGLTSLKKWYDLEAQKNDFNVYLKQQTRFSNHWHWFYDLQFRHIKYDLEGFRNNPALFIGNTFNFLNPKAGISYYRNNWKGYASFGVANKEPNRDDFEAGIAQQPKPERLQDVEIGVEKTGKKYNWSATMYYMNYKDQLVLTGKINDVGAYTRTNIPKSYRAGIELRGTYKFNEWLNATANLAMSRNKVKKFTEYIDDYDNGGQKMINHPLPDIAFSPAIVGGGSINLMPVKNGELSLLSKYVGKQHLDNTQNNNRVLDAFYAQDIRAMYTVKPKWLKEINIIAQVNNIFNRKYEPNGYTFSYIYGGVTTTENYYFPMAGTNYMLALNIKL
jgi:iron complex outermembrane receptor protein